MTGRYPPFRRSAAAVLLTVCAGCSAVPFTFPGLSPKPRTFDEQKALAEQRPADATIKELSPSESCRVCMTTAKELEAHGKEPAAIEQYERARSFMPKQSGIAARLAVLYDRAGNHERASAEYASALKEDSKNADLWNDFAYFQFQRTEFVEAETAARKALKINPEHKRCWVNLGLIEAEQEKYDDAFASFTKAVSPAAAHNNLGMILARQGKNDQARKELAEARRMDPTLKQPTAVLDYLDAESTDTFSSSSREKKEGVKPAIALHRDAAKSSKNSIVASVDDGDEVQLHGKTRLVEP